MPERIRVRDVARGETYELGPDEPVLRGSYDLFHPDGPVSVRDDGLVEWTTGPDVRISRTVSTTLGLVRVGERVLVRGLESDEWWLCDVLAVDGVSGSL